MQNIRLNIPLALSITDRVSAIENEIKKFGEPLRWAIVKAKSSPKQLELTIEATILDKNDNAPKKSIAAPANTSSFPDKPVFVNLVPTGIHAAMGGSLGDAMPVNVLLSKLGLVVTHPNVCNGGPLFLADRKSLIYTEGYSLDTWAKGEVNLCPTEPAKIGVVIDSGVKDKWVLDRAWNAIWGFHAHTGANIVGVEITKEGIGGRARLNKSGAFVGEVKNLTTAHEAVEKLLKKGADRIAIFTYVKIDNSHWTAYFKDKLPNPVGGTEAIISHSITRKFGISAAHAPLVKKREEKLIESYGRVRPSAAIEAADPLYFWCVLRGLQDAPGITKPGKGLAFKNASALICPATSMGGIPMLQAEKLGIPIIGVTQNTTVLDVKAKDLNFKNAIEVKSYVIAAGILAKAKEDDDFSFKNIQKISKLPQKTLFTWGEKLALRAEVEPRTLLRPLNPVI